jgi:ribosomal subunit interface protein
MDIIFKSRRTNIPERFREHAVGKLVKIGKLDHKAIRIDVEVSKERNPRQSGRRERVELTIQSRGPVIRAEAAADDRYTALDLAYAKLEARLRRACDRRKERHGDRDLIRAGSAAAAATAAEAAPPDMADADLPGLADESAPPPDGNHNGHRMPRPAGLRTREGPEEYDLDEDLDGEELESAHFVPIQMEGDGPLVVREKMHPADPMTIDQALLQMELVGHDFYLFHDCDCDLFSVVYRRRGYDYGVIRLMEGSA